MPHLPLKRQSKDAICGLCYALAVAGALALALALDMATDFASDIVSADAEYKPLQENAVRIALSYNA